MRFMFGGEWQDSVVIRLGDGVPHAKSAHMLLVRRDYRLVGAQIMAFEPGSQRWADVEADVAEVPGLRVGPVAFGVDLLVEIVIGLGARFGRYLARKRVLSWRLIKVCMYRKIFVTQS